MSKPIFWENIVYLSSDECAYRVVIGVVICSLLSIAKNEKKKKQKKKKKKKKINKKKNVKMAFYSQLSIPKKR